ncbi:putative calcium-binding protein [Lasiodiplodia hormozganensis]|uniref:Calcium-binding protein n=1 Tax=Lasiodiplodia hormozganensis TaxID=869390 RepID=A0AA39WV49_9PEZI|nr:putative calcium-binding protein [Lasiodiplodia hormozganensis]
MKVSITASLGLFAATVLAHGEHGSPEVPADADWATRHMAEEHHIATFDASTFFTLHDYDSTGKWSPDDVRKTYGLLDESAATIPQSKKDEVVKIVFQLFDKDDSGDISKEEYVEATNNGVKLPDFGTGPGHHGDDEYEYEIHHFEKYHGGDDVQEEDLIHPEDIEHFAKHDRLDAEQERLEAQEKMSIVEANIPAKFRRNN